MDEPSRGRALAYLARRGYDSELAYEAVRELERRARLTPRAPLAAAGGLRERSIRGYDRRAAVAA